MKVTSLASYMPTCDVGPYPFLGTGWPHLRPPCVFAANRAAWHSLMFPAAVVPMIIDV